MKNTVFAHKFWRPFLDCMPQLFFRPQYVWFPIHLKGHLIPLWYETLVVNWQNWLFILIHQSRSVLSPNPIDKEEITSLLPKWWVTFAQTGQAQNDLKGFIPKIKSGSHLFISKVVKVSSSPLLDTGAWRSSVGISLLLGTGTWHISVLGTGTWLINIGISSMLDTGR